MQGLRTLRETDWGRVRHADQDQLLSYWEEALQTEKVRQNDGVPLRERFDPVDLPNLLPRIALIETVDIVEPLGDGDVQGGRGVDFRYRLTGTEIVRRAGRDPTGKTFSDLYEGDYLEAARKTYLDLMASGLPHLSERTFSSKDGNQIMQYDRLILPYSSDGLRVDRFVLLVNVTGQNADSWIEGSFRVYGSSAASS